MRKIVTAAALASTLAFAMPAQAATGSESGTVDVTARLTAACFIGNGTLSFGDITSIAQGTAGTKADTVNTDAETGAISYVCSNGATASLAIEGLNDDEGQFRMASGSNNLGYEIYSDAQRTSRIEPGATNVALVANGVNQTLTLYGRVPGAGANQQIGNYADTLTLTVSY